MRRLNHTPGPWEPATLGRNDALKIAVDGFSKDTPCVLRALDEKRFLMISLAPLNDGKKAQAQDLANLRLIASAPRMLQSMARAIRAIENSDKTDELVHIQNELMEVFFSALGFDDEPDEDEIDPIIDEAAKPFPDSVG